MDKNEFAAMAQRLYAWAHATKDSVFFVNGYLGHDIALNEMGETPELSIYEADTGGRDNGGERVTLTAETVESFDFSEEDYACQIVATDGEGYDIEVYALGRLPFPPAPQASTYKGVDGKTYRERLKPVKITVERLEGQAHECYPRAFTSYAAANAWLLQASQSAPRDGSYDKVKFTIEFPDGSRYNGRYDLGHHSVDPCNIQKHVLSALTWDAFHPDAQKVLSFTQIQTAREMLDRLDFGQAPQEVSNA